MDNIKTINDEMAVADCQLSPEQIQKAAAAGFKSILNLRSPQEEGYLANEAEQAEAAGLEYANIPVKPNALDDNLADEVLAKIDRLPKPILSHCKSGLRSGLFALMHDATRNDLSVEMALEKGENLGIPVETNPKMQAFLEDYISNHSAD